MPWLMCLDCEVGLRYERKLEATLAPIRCKCGGFMVRERDHPSFLPGERAHLAVLESPASSDYENRMNGTYFAPDRLARAIRLCKARIERMVRISRLKTDSPAAWAAPKLVKGEAS